VFSNPTCFFCHQLVRSAPNFAYQQRWCGLQDEPAKCSAVLAAVSASFSTFAQNPQAQGMDVSAAFVQHGRAVCATMCK
jgi:hypothetical protein